MKTMWEVTTLTHAALIGSSLTATGSCIYLQFPNKMNVAEQAIISTRYLYAWPDSNQLMTEKAKQTTGDIPLDGLSDEALVALINQTEDAGTLRACQEIIYDRYAQRVYYKCLSITKDRESSKDLTHDIMVKVLLKLKTFRGESPLFGWIFAVTYNHCLSWLQAQNKMRLEDFDNRKHELAEDNSEIAIKQLKELRLERIQALMDELSESDRMILMMRYQDGMAVKEIADVLKLGESAVKMRLKRSRDRLAQLIQNTYHDE